MEFNLADNTIKRVEAWVARSPGASPDEVINQALDCFEKSHPVSSESAPRNPDSVIARFRKYRGMLAGVTVEDIVKWRREGLR